MSEPAWIPRDRVDAAGEVLRRHGRGETIDPAALSEAFDVLKMFRREWETESDPAPRGILRGVAGDLIGLMKNLLGPDCDVSHRLKRAERIVDKLARLPALSLSGMQDIGGCRVVLRLKEPTDVPSALDALRSHDGFRVVRESDYVARPKRDGYRAHHLIVESVGHLVEIQVRTENQQRWANAVERMEQVTGRPLRGSNLPAELAEALRVVSDVFAISDRGESVPLGMAPRLVGALAVIGRWSKLRT